jgi:DMSO/TMAO reductase YedYZ molybdopterin-dependent catalytic subunit
MTNSQFSRKELENHMRQEDRLPPGQILTERLPILHYGLVPTFDPASWDFRIWGEVEETLTLTWEEFSRLPRIKITLDLHCVTGWSKFNTTWEGASVSTLVENGLIKPKPSANFVMQHAEYGFSANLPIDVVLSNNFLLATHYEGEPITPDHGYPLRGLVGAIPGQKDTKDVYLWKGAKWLRGLEFMKQDRAGFWEQAGYHNQADIWKEQRFA